MERIPGVRRLFRFPRRSAGQIGDDVDEEIAFHLDMRADELARRGMPPEAARAQARREFGDVDETRRAVRAMDRRAERRSRVLERLDGARQDLRFAARSLLRTPGFTAAAALTLALGAGATTALFSVVDAVLLRPLPVHEPDRLVSVRVEKADGSVEDVFSWPYVRDWRSAAAPVAEVAATHYGGLSFSAGGEAEMVTSVDATDNYFRVLGLRPAAGRLFAPGDDAAAPVVVLSHGFWTRRFGADPGVVGRAVRLNGQPLTVIGVAPPGFAGTLAGVRTDVFVPVGIYPLLNPGGDLDTRGRHGWLVMFARLRAGVSVDRAGAALDAVARRVEPEFADDPAPRGARVDALTGLPARARGGAVGFMALLSACAGLVLLIAATNVAGMLLARASARRREIAIRLALGAGRGRLARLLLAESLLLFLAGGAAGTLLAVWATSLLRGWSPPVGVPVTIDAAVSPAALAFALGLSLATGLVFGLAPALAASRPVLVPALKDGAGGGRRARLRSAFVVGQLAMSMLLLVTAGLFARALQSALSIDPGFRPDGVLVGEVRLAPHGYDEARGAEAFRQLLERVRARPEVRAATLASLVPVAGESERTRVRRAEDAPAEGDGGGVSVGVNTVDDDYFRTMEVRLLAGRAFSPADRPGSPPVAVVNETLARRLWPGESPVGRRLTSGGRTVEVVGVARDGRYEELREDPLPYVYFPFSQNHQAAMTLHVRHDGAPAAALAAVRAELRAVDPDVPLAGAMPMAARIGVTLVPQRIAAVLVGGFGAAGLLLAAVGMYGVLAYTVSQRTREIGVRMALGAGAGAVLRMVVRQGLLLCALGVAIGLGAALLAARAIRGMLFGLSAADPATFVAVPLLVGLAALLASWLPARRAARVDPVVALRAE